MKKLVFLLAIVTYEQSFAQYYYYNDRYLDNAFLAEAGISICIINACTDLGKKSIDWRNSKPCVGIFFTGLYQYKIGVRLEAVLGKIAASDNILKPIAAESSGRYERNLSFSSKIKDIQLGLEFHPLY